jgi:hypothetical protein
MPDIVSRPKLLGVVAGDLDAVERAGMLGRLAAFLALGPADQIGRRFRRPRHKYSSAPNPTAHGNSGTIPFVAKTTSANTTHLNNSLTWNPPSNEKICSALLERFTF